MKSLRTLLSVAVLGTLIALSGCGGGGGSSEPISDQQLGKLKKTWKVDTTYPSGGVTYGAPGSSNTVDSTSHWTLFKLTIDGTKGQPSTFTYTCTGRELPNIWEASGTWEFGTKPESQIVRGDGALIGYSINPAATTLTLSFSFDKQYGARVSNVTGNYTFHLIPN